MVISTTTKKEFNCFQINKKKREEFKNFINSLCST